MGILAETQRLKRISITSQKGGTGKTTIALHLAAALTNEGANVLFIDLDLMGTAATAGEILKPKFTIIQAEPGKIPEALEHGQDFIFYDLPRFTGVSDLAYIEMLKRVNIALVPVRPSLFDIWAGLEYMDFLQKIPVKKYAAFINMEDRTNDAREAAEILTQSAHPYVNANIPRLKGLEIRDLSQPITAKPEGERFAPFYRTFKNLIK